MPRKNLIRSDTHPYHITSRTNNRESFPIPLNEVWEIVQFECLYLSLIYGVEFQSVVLMPNHIHIILTVPESDLGYIANILFKNLAIQINTKSGRTGHVWGGAYYWQIIRSARYYGHALKYVYRNPVRAGLCDQVEDYPFSTAYGLLGKSHLGFPLFYTRCGMEHVIPNPDRHFDWINWLNIPFSKEAEKLVRSSLRRREVKALIQRTSRRPHPLLEELL